MLNYIENKDNTNMKFILLYGSECRQVVKGDMAKIDAFHNGYLRKICHIFWPIKISKIELLMKMGCNRVCCPGK